MLDKLRLNKFLIPIVLLVVLASCYRYKKHLYNTEISCPNRMKILARYASLEQVKSAIQKAYDEKKKYGTSENYTVIGFGYQKSFKIERLPPEEAVKCGLSQIEIDPASQEYKKYKYYK